MAIKLFDVAISIITFGTLFGSVTSKFDSVHSRTQNKFSVELNGKLVQSSVNGPYDKSVICATERSHPDFS